ncbi:hypothetical protein JYP51_10070 [Ponticoccus gilvus]|nr:hypothetical protein [Enemella evansiae]
MTRLPLLLALLPLPALAQAAGEADPAFDALASALTTGTPGEIGSSTLLRGEGCAVTYEVRDTYDGLSVTGTVTIDVAKLKPGSARTDSSTPLNVLYDGEDGFYEATIAAPLEQADLFEQISGQPCEAAACSATMSSDRLHLTLVGDNAQERAARTIAAMKAFHASCTE